MKRQWFRDDDGLYYRNIPIILDEIHRAQWIPWRWYRLRGLWREWDHAWDEGLIRKPALGRRDVLRQPAPMREAYPDHPVFWQLDERMSDHPRLTT